MAKKEKKGKHTGTSVTLVRTRPAAIQRSDTKIPATLGAVVGKGGASFIYGFEPALDTDRVAKIYNDTYRKDASLDVLNKLLAVVVRHTELSQQLPFVMWPDELVFDRPNVSGAQARDALLGFTMPRLPAGTMSLYELLKVAKHRPRFQSGDTVRLAARLADHMARLHAAGIVFCDMNPKNIHVAKADLGELFFLDADGFQLSLGARMIASRGVTEGYASPAAIANHQSNPTALRVPGDDDFVLAILIFQLLLDRAHPFQTGPLYAEHPGASHNDNIVARRFAYAKPQLYHPEADTLAVYACLATPLKAFFHRAFLTPTPPTASEWARLLSGHLTTHLAAATTPEPSPDQLKPPTPPPSSQQAQPSRRSSSQSVSSTTPPTAAGTAQNNTAPVYSNVGPRRRPSRPLLIAAALAIPVALAARGLIGGVDPAPPALSVAELEPLPPVNEAPERVRIINLKQSPEVNRMLAELPDTLAYIHATVRPGRKTAP